MTNAESVQIAKELTIALLGKMGSQFIALDPDHGPKWVAEAYNTILKVIKPEETVPQIRRGINT